MPRTAPTFTVEPTGRTIYPKDAMPYPEYRVTCDGAVRWTGNHVSCENERRMAEYNARTRYRPTTVVPTDAGS